MVEAMDIKGDFQKTEIGEYPIDWNIKELSVILKSKQLGGNYPNSDLNEEYVLIKMGNLGRGFIDLKKKFYIKSGTIPQQIDKINYGDILFNTRNTLDLVGKVAIWKEELPLAFFNSNIMRLVFKDEEISSNFFMNYILNTPKSLYQLRGIATGTTSVAAIYTRDLIKIKVPVPTKAEQAAIATALNDADALITQLEKLIAKKRAIKQGAMQELLKPKEGWQEKKLGEECELITKGTTPTSVGRNFQSSGINFIKIESLTENGKIIKDKVAFIDSYTNSLLKRSQLKSGDTLFSIAGALGRVAIVSDQILPANTNQALAIIRLKNDTEIDLKYLFYFLNSRKIQTLILAINVQGAQANLSLQNISDLPIKYPLRTEQTRIAQILSDMDAEIEALENKLNKYKMIKQGMMQNLLTGRIRLV